MSAQLTILNLGWGVQSWTLAAMVALGELGPVDFAIHADTTWERSATYEFARAWAPWLVARGLAVVTVADREQAQAVATYQTDIPAFTGSEGQIRRQCTGRWKIDPIRRHIARALAERGEQKRPGAVEQWIGISADEWPRAKDADVQYITHRWPLLERSMTRGDCENWLRDHDLPIPPKSSCVFCPFHTLRSWRELKRAGGADWQKAVEVDQAIRNVRPRGGQLFIHPGRRPLPEAVNIPEDHGMTQPGLFDQECDSGFCFV